MKKQKPDIESLEKEQRYIFETAEQIYYNSKGNKHIGNYTLREWVECIEKFHI